jgi:hypothetical protein
MNKETIKIELTEEEMKIILELIEKSIEVKQTFASKDEYRLRDYIKNSFKDFSN